MRVAISILVTAAVAITPASASGAAGGHCSRRRSVTVRADAGGRIFRVNRDGFDEYYGCLYSKGIPWSIGDDDGGPFDEVDGVKLASPYAVIAQGFGSGDSGVFDDLNRVDLRNGHEVQLDEFGVPAGGCCPGSSFFLNEVLVTHFGAVAWLLASADPPPQPNLVRKHDHTGPATLDSGMVREHSLGLSHTGRTLYWTNGSQRRSAPLR